MQITSNQYELAVRWEMTDKKTEVQFNLRTFSGPQTCLHMRIIWQGVLVTKLGKLSVHMGLAWNGE